jgi:uracil-DNA glycosylase
VIQGLRLYPEIPRALVERTNGTSSDADCKRCRRSADCKSVCLRGEGEPGGVLVVGEAPTSHEDHGKRPFMGPVGAKVRSEEHTSELQTLS